MTKEKVTKEKINKEQNGKENKKIQYENPKLVKIEGVGTAVGHMCPFGGVSCVSGSFEEPQ